MSPNTPKMISAYEGVRRVSYHGHRCGEIGRRVVELAEEAARRGTFGVGGIILTKSGDVLAEATNAVVRDGRVTDPTAHVERQLIDWLFAEGGSFYTAHPDDLVIVSSLDPCAMCAGAILRAGVNVISLAEDEKSGVHGVSGQPISMPESLRRLAARHMALYGVDGHRPAVGADLGPLFHRKLPGSLYRRAEQAFAVSVGTVRSLVAGNAEHVANMTGITPYRQIVAQYLGSEPELLPLEIDRLGDRWPVDLGCMLEDQHGLVILGVRNERGAVPTLSSVVRLIRFYSWLRSVVPDEMLAVLPHPRWCTVVTKDFPESDDMALFELGAIGSFMEERRPPQARAALMYQSVADSHRPQRLLDSLPPLYTREIGLSIARWTGRKGGLPFATTS